MLEPEVVHDHGFSLRRLTDPAQLRALAHPRRMDLLDLLATEGPLTASACAERLGDSAASCSYHLRQLARFGFVEEAPGGTGRRRPWRWVPVGNRFETASGSPAQRAAGDQLAAVVDARNAEKVRTFRAHQHEDPWVDAALSADWTLQLTEEELGALGRDLTALLAPYQARVARGEVPEGARVVDALTYLLPRPARGA